MGDLITKHRRKLNEEQIEVLKLLYMFRFGSNDLFARYFGKKDRSFVYKRLNILLEQGFIGKRFDSSYRIQGKPAAYYLTPAGARVYEEQRKPHKDPVKIQQIYKDKTVSEQFVEHCLDIFTVYVQLRKQYGSTLSFFTKTNLNYECYEHFPQPLPDAYFYIETDEGEAQFFMDLYHDNQPFFKAVRRIKQYIKYNEDADWTVTETPLPRVLAVCDSSSLAKRLQKRMAKELDNAWAEDEVTFALTTKAQLLSGDIDIWQLADEPDEIFALEDMV